MATNIARSTTSPADLSAANHTPPAARPASASRGKPPLDTPPVWVTVTDAVRLAGIGRTMIYRMIGDGTLRTTTIGRRRLIAYASIEALGGVARQ